MRIIPAVLLLLPAIAGAQSDFQQVGDFTVAIRVDAMTDADRSYATTDRLSGNTGMEALTFKCLDDGLNVIVETKYLAGDSDDEVRVLWRFAPDPASTPRYWGAMTGNRGWWMPMSLVTSFIETAKTRSEVTLRVVDPLDGETLTATFSLRGLGNALERLPCYRQRTRPKS